MTKVPHLAIHIYENDITYDNKTGVSYFALM